MDAILSLWLAAEMARLSEKEEDTGKQSRDDWRRKQAGLDAKHTYCRILGDDAEDGCLERNLAWWVDESIAEESKSLIGSAPSATNAASVQGPRWYASQARSDEVDSIIGFNGGVHERQLLTEFIA